VTSETPNPQRSSAKRPAPRVNPSHLSAKERVAAGKVLRKKIPRSAHAKWKAPANRHDPVQLLKKADHGRLPELLPIRYARMKASPFAFFRGADAVMAGDLAVTPKSGLRVQACGDCHVSNFGGYGSPERRLVFDINDFDETLQAPWEWDVKRLATSIVLVGRGKGDGEHRCEKAVGAAVQTYREHMTDYARRTALQVWYSELDADILIQNARSPGDEEYWEAIERKAKSQTAAHVFPRMTARAAKGQPRIIDNPPLIYHPRQHNKLAAQVKQMFQSYRLTLPEERRVLLDRYHIVDIARKVVGVGSVGTRCAVVLLMADAHDPLFLQFKEALPSALDPYAGKSRFAYHGERVVTGQRMLQSASDIFLGWTRDEQGHDYYFRQLRDMKMTVNVEDLDDDEWLEYVQLCGWTLARAHARTGDAARIAGYLGDRDVFDEAIAKFAAAYADQTEQDHKVFVKAIASGKINATAKI
jgi:uncharacterized protein (DUF2252 family)